MSVRDDKTTITQTELQNPGCCNALRFPAIFGVANLLRHCLISNIPHPSYRAREKSKVNMRRSTRTFVLNFDIGTSQCYYYGTTGVLLCYHGSISLCRFYLCLPSMPRWNASDLTNKHGPSSELSTCCKPPILASSVSSTVPHQVPVSQDTDMLFFFLASPISFGV